MYVRMRWRVGDGHNGIHGPPQYLTARQIQQCDNIQSKGLIIYLITKLKLEISL